MISKAKISVASFCCHKVLLLWTKTVYFFVDNRLVLLWQLLFLWMIGFVVANVVFVEDWFRCGNCCYSGRLVLIWLWQVLLLWKIGFVVASVVIMKVHSQVLIRSLLSPDWTRRLLQNVRLGSLGISDSDYRWSINRLVLSWSCNLLLDVILPILLALQPWKSVCFGQKSHQSSESVNSE